MAGPSCYRTSKELIECWSIPLEHSGCNVDREPDRANVHRWKVRRAGALVRIGSKDNELLLVFSSLLGKRGKNFCLAADVEKILLASGAKVYGEPVSTNLVYRVDVQPDETWLKRLNSAAIEVQFMRDADQRAVQHPSGEFLAAGGAIRFSTGPAIEPQTKCPVHFVALDADAADLARSNPEPFLKSVDAALSGNGATRLKVQLEMDALKK